jgi:hypothetical protein
VAGAVLFARTLANLLTVDAGFRQDNILIAQFDLSRLPVPNRPTVKKEILDRLRNLAGVDAAAEVGIVPVSGMGQDNRVWADGENRQSGFDPNFNSIGSGYFKTFGTPLLAGRGFDEQDTPNSPKVAIEMIAGAVNQASFRRYFEDRGKTQSRGVPGTDPGCRRVLSGLDLTGELQRVI